MLADGRTVPDGETISCDVCIVGAGPAGLVLAQALAGADRNIVVLERGSRIRTGRPADPGTVESVGLRYPIAATRGFGIGGSSQEWSVDTPLGGGMGRLRELDDIDFERRDWIPHSGWPLSKGELARHYASAREVFGRHGEVGSDHADPETALLTDGVAPRAFWFGDAGAFVRLAGRLEHAPSVIVLTNAAAMSLESEGREVSHVRVLTESSRFRVRAKIFVLASGGLEVPRILLASVMPNGRTLGNEHDQIGRYFMEHPHYASGLVSRCSGEAIDRVAREAFYRLSDRTVVERQFSLPEATVEREGLQRIVYSVAVKQWTPRLALLTYGDRARRSVYRAIDLRTSLKGSGFSWASARQVVGSLGVSPGLLRFGTDHVVASVSMRTGRRPGSLKISAMAEQIPNPDSRVRLTSRLGPDGVPVAQVDWRLTDEDLSGMRRSQDLFGVAFAANGLPFPRNLLEGRTLVPGLIGGAHHMGTARMGMSPRRSATDRNGQVHGVPNLFVAGSSVFPTVGFANPTLTVVALAVRLAEHLRGRLATWI